MATAPLKPCYKCKRVLTRSTYCPDCAVIVAKQQIQKAKERAKAQESTRNSKSPEHKAIYNNSRWAKASLTFRDRNPLCASCFERGITTPAACVDHIIPHEGDWKLFWDSSNWQSLCWSCHSIKTARERGGWGRAVKTGKTQKN